MIQVVVEDGSARFGPKKWVNIEVALPTSDAVARSFVIILDPISKRAGMGYREVDVDGSREVRGKPVDAFIISR